MASRKDGKKRIVDILLVEDSPADVLLMQEAISDGGTAHNLSVVGNGDDAMNFLRKRGAYSSAPRPDLVLLDLNLPKKDGREVLAEIKNDDALKSIPVVVITTSRSDEDVFRSYNLHANAYITKPVRLARFFTIIKYIEEFWFGIVTLPGIKGQPPQPEGKNGT